MIYEGQGWRLGWKPDQGGYCALVAGDHWSIELESIEFQQFYHLLTELQNTLQSIQNELMEEESITCELENQWLWMEISGYPHHFDLHFILQQNRRCEGGWTAEIVQEILPILASLKIG